MHNSNKINKGRIVSSSITKLNVTYGQSLFIHPIVRS